MTARLPAILALLLLTGCPPDPQPKTPTTLQAVQTRVTITPADPDDARPMPPRVVTVDVFLVEAPLGSLSADAALWRRIDESAVGTAASLRLAKNGVRCGVARRSDSALLSDLLGRKADRVKRQTVSGVDPKSLDLDLARKVRSQTILFFNDRDQLEGRTFDDCEDGFSLSYRLTPRRTDAVRLTLCPTVRVPRLLSRFTPTQIEYGVPTTEIARVYDASLSIDVPGDSLLVVAPGPDSARVTSIGGQFLTRDDDSQRTELVLVIAPTTLSLNGQPTDILAIPTRGANPDEHR